MTSISQWSVKSILRNITASGRDVFRVRIDLDGRPIVGPGRVWLVVHEGAWASPGDGTSIYATDPDGRTVELKITGGKAAERKA